MRSRGVLKSFVAVGACAGAVAAVLVPGSGSVVSASSGVSVTAQGDRTIWMSTRKPGPKLLVTYQVADPQRRATTFESCLYDVDEGEDIRCKTYPLLPGDLVERTPGGWTITRVIQYRKPVSPADCDWVNYHWPKFRSTISLFAQDGSRLARGQHGFVAKCRG